MVRPAPDDVERTFDADAIEQLARVAKLPIDGDLARFGDSVRIAARIFVEAKARLSAPKVRDAIERLYRLNARAERGGDRVAQELARAVGMLPDDVRRWLTSANGRQGRAIPTAKEILSPVTRKRAIERLRLIVSYGGQTTAGRKRAGGRRSRTFKPLLRVPQKVERGRPAGLPEREFVQWLAVAYLEATEQPPPDTAHYNPDIRGPFSALVHRCFELVGAPTGNVTRLINQYGTLRRRARGT